MSSLAQAARRPDFPAEIALVLSNRPGAAGLESAKRLGLTITVADHKAYAGRSEFEDRLQQILDEHRIDLICLAGFMRLLTPAFAEVWAGRILNIHPALLPSYRGLHTHERALADGVRIHGCSAHFVVAGMDEGPIIAQAAVPVLDEDTPDTLAARVLEQEHRVYPLALELVAAGRARLQDGRVRLDGPLAVGSALISPLLAETLA
jgi:phosphoribosylglycinamide formyltransferase-1